jgi:excisionase family DNA binding protein
MANSTSEMIFTPRWYTVAQVAQLLNCGESKVRMLIITGKLRSIKDGRSRRILPEWVEAFVQDRAKSTEDAWLPGRAPPTAVPDPPAAGSQSSSAVCGV